MAQERAGTMKQRREGLYLCNHHVAVKGAPPVDGAGALDMGAHLGDNGGAKGHVWHEVACQLSRALVACC